MEFRFSAVDFYLVATAIAFVICREGEEQEPVFKPTPARKEGTLEEYIS
jgi:hypothetical protein